MALAAEEREALRNALISAFPTFPDMDRLADRLDTSLEAVAGRGPLRDVTLAFVRAAIAGGWEDRLVSKAIAAQPGNPDLRRFLERNWLPLSAPPERQLETMIRPGETFQDFDMWIARLQEAGPRVCTISVATSGGTMRGTGFLIASDLVLTNYHVLEPVILGEQGRATPADSALREGLSARASDVSFIFDYKEVPGGAQLTPGRHATLRQGALSEWLVDESPYSPLDLQTSPGSVPSVDELDYAVVRLADAPGDDPVNGQRRGYVPVPAAPEVTPDSALFIIQHPQGQPLKLAFHVVREIKPTRITYGTNTREGSSGSPCFDYRWDLVALHHSGDPAYKTTNNQGIPIAAIRRRLTQQGVSLPS